MLVIQGDSTYRNRVLRFRRQVGEAPWLSKTRRAALKASIRLLLSNHGAHHYFFSVTTGFIVACDDC